MCGLHDTRIASRWLNCFIPFGQNPPPKTTLGSWDSSLQVRHQERCRWLFSSLKPGMEHSLPFWNAVSVPMLKAAIRPAPWDTQKAGTLPGSIAEKGSARAF